MNFYKNQKLQFTYFINNKTVLGYVENIKNDKYYIKWEDEHQSDTWTKEELIEAKVKPYINIEEELELL